MNTRAYEVSGMAPRDNDDLLSHLVVWAGSYIYGVYVPKKEYLTVGYADDSPDNVEQDLPDNLKIAFESIDWINVEVKELGAAVEVKGEENE